MPFTIRPHRRFPVQCARERACRFLILGRGPHAILWSNALRSCLRLNDPINGHRAVCAGLGRGVNHTAGILMKSGTGDVDGAALSLPSRC